MNIAKIHAYQIFDSRGTPTIEAPIISNDSTPMHSVSLLLVIAIFITGLGGCMVTGITVSKIPCKMVEQGHLKTFYGVDHSWAAFGDGGSGPLTLVECPPPEWATWCGYLSMFTPIQRRMGGGDYDLLEIAIAMVEKKGHWSQKRTPSRWIIGNDPLVVAIGTDEEDLNPNSAAGISDAIGLGAGYHVVAETDLDRKAVELVVLTRWPSHWPVVGHGGDPEEDLRDELAAERLVWRIKLEKAATLREIMTAQLWEHDNPPPPKPLTSEERAVITIRRTGGRVEREDDSPESPVVSVDAGFEMTNSDLKCLKMLPRLRILRLGLTKVTDAGVDNLIGLTTLERLDLPDKVSYAGIKKLKKALPNCRISP